MDRRVSLASRERHRVFRGNSTAACYPGSAARLVFIGNRRINAFAKVREVGDVWQITMRTLAFIACEAHNLPLVQYPESQT